MFGRDLKDKSFPALFAADSRREIEEIVGAVADEMLPAIAGLTATSSRRHAFASRAPAAALQQPRAYADQPDRAARPLRQRSTAHSASSRFPPGATSIRRNSPSSRARCASCRSRAASWCMKGCGKRFALGSDCMLSNA